MVNISNYDQFDYDYKNYWDNREYEDRAEKIVLEKFFENIQGIFCLDIGGSFGRNLSIYHDKFAVPIILDYSLKTLQKNQSDILKKYPKTNLIAANAYKMPFKANTIDTALMIRVLHHLEDQNGLFEEISRTIPDRGNFILEYANKMHIKATLKWFFTFKLKNFSQEPYQQPNKSNFEGTEDGQTTVFLNYHPKYIKNMLNKWGFTVLKKRNCSFLRMRLLKKLLPLKLILSFEKFLQNTMSWLNITPSIILKTKKGGYENEKKFGKIEDVLCCPECKNDLDIDEKEAKCESCKNIFLKKDGVWDFRI